MTVRKRARQEGVFEVGLAWPVLIGRKRERRQGKGSRGEEGVAAGKPCLGEKKASLFGDLREGRNDIYRHRLVAFNLFIIHMPYENFWKTQ